MQRAPPQSCILDPRRNGGASRVAEGPRARYGRARGARAHPVLRARRSRAHGSVGVGVSPSCVRRRSCRWRTCGVRHRESDIPARRRAPTTHGAGAHMIHMDRRNFCYAPPWYNINHVDGSTLTSSVVVLLTIFGSENGAEFRQHLGCFGVVFGIGFRH